MEVEIYPHFGELSLVGVERDEDLIGHLVAEILPEHLNVLGLDREEVVARPVRLVHLGHALVKGLARCLHSCNKFVEK